MQAMQKRNASEILADQRSAKFTREFAVERSAINVDARTADLSFASETPVERWYGMEILDCTSEKACDLGRLRNGGALLLDHDAREQIGVVKVAEIKDRKCRATVRFSRSAKAQEIFQDVQDGIRSLVSVGYRVKNLVLTETDEKAGDSYRVTEWEPYEISLVSIPADATVGVGRSREQPVTVNVIQTPTKPLNMENEIRQDAPSTPITATPRASAPSMSESQRMNEIRAIGANFNVPTERVIKALAENEPLDTFRAYVLETHLKAQPVAVPPTIGMNRAEKKRYSLTRAINRIASHQPLDGVEKEASDECARKFRREAPSAGFILPHDMSEFADREMTAAMLRVSPSLRHTAYGRQLTRALEGGTFTGAGALVTEEFLGGSFIELLRNRTLLTQLGVGTMSGLVGNVAIPRQSGAATAYWLAEGAAITASAQQFAQVAATPKRLAAQTAYSKQLLAQSSLDAEAIVRDDHVRIIAIAKDLAGVAGTGGAQPLGILNGPTVAADGNKVGTVTFGTTATRNNLLSFMSTIQSANADLGTMQWLTNPTVRAKWQSLVQVANYPVYLTNDDGVTIGYPTNITNQISTTGTFANRAIFGAWGQALFCDWAGMDIVVDPYTRAANNEVVVTVNMFTDFVVRHWPSFAISTDSAAQ